MGKGRYETSGHQKFSLDDYETITVGRLPQSSRQHTHPKQIRARQLRLSKFQNFNLMRTLGLY
jgi:hypothetical protein